MRTDIDIHYSKPADLSPEAEQLVEFDVTSLGQLIAARREPEPGFWLAAPEGYQSETHVLRDSPTIRLVAYSDDSRTLYATDGCNSCLHTLAVSIADTTHEELVSLAKRIQLPSETLERLVRLVQERRSPSLSDSASRHGGRTPRR